MRWKMAHVNEYVLKEAMKRKTIQGLKFKMNVKVEECEVCIRGKGKCQDYTI